MVPNIYIHEQLMHEYVQERQREIEQRQLLAHQQPRHRMMWHPIAGLGIFFMAFGGYCLSRWWIIQSSLLAVNFGIPWAESVQLCERGRTHPFREEKPCFGGCRALQEKCEGRERERKALI